MKRTIWKRGCSLLLTLVLVIGLLPATALAAENTDPTVDQFATVEQLRTASNRQRTGPGCTKFLG